MVTKALHLEVVTELTNEAFLAALKRLIGRRGLPSEIFCDNATNFVGANNKLSELKAFLFRKETKYSMLSFCSNQFITYLLIWPLQPVTGLSLS